MVECPFAWCTCFQASQGPWDDCPLEPSATGSPGSQKSSSAGVQESRGTALRNWLAWMPCFHCGSHLDFRGRRAPASPPQSPPKANSKTASPNPRVVRYPKAAVSFMESAWATWTWSREQTHTYGPDFSARSLFPPDARVSWWLQSKHQFFVALVHHGSSNVAYPVQGTRHATECASGHERGDWHLNFLGGGHTLTLRSTPARYLIVPVVATP